MSMRQTEYPNNTMEQVRDYIATAWQIVDGLELPPDLEPKAFELAVGLVSSKQIVLEQVGGVLPFASPNAR